MLPRLRDLDTSLLSGLRIRQRRQRGSGVSTIYFQRRSLALVQRQRQEAPWAQQLPAHRRAIATNLVCDQRAPVQPGDTVTFKLVLSDPIAPPLLALQLTDSLPSGLTLVPGSLRASSGTASENGSAISWSGTQRSGKPITITFQAQVSAAISGTAVLTNRAQLSGRRTATFRSTLIVNGQGIWLPSLRR